VRHYAEATIAVVPSLYEGFGLPAGEAMACAVPLVSTDGGALPEIVGDAGVVVPAGRRAH
jgi:glycosyltransferase involved in cell wall biosynthesis